MKSRYAALSVLCLVLSLCAHLLAQQPSTEPSSVVPKLVNFSGHTTDAPGKTISGVVGATFSIYNQQFNGTPLWTETQNVTADGKGNFVAQLGASKPDGLPLDVFSSGEARWLGVRINGGEEQPRVLLLSVPYALKAADAQTLGGLPPSAFVLAAPPIAGNIVGGGTAANSTSGQLNPAISGSGTTNYVPLWTPNGTTLGSSVLFQLGTGATAKIGIDTATPATTLDVKGAATVRGPLSLPVTAAATASAGKNSQPETFTASAFNSGSKAAVNQVFKLQSEPVGNNTATPSGTLSLLYGSGAATPAETGFKISSKGQITFASGQTFPGVGTVSSVGFTAPNSDFNVSGTPVNGSGTIALSWTIPPTSADTPNAIVKRDDGGDIAAGEIVLNSVDVGVSATGANNGVYGTTTNSFGNGVWGYNPNHTGVYGDGGVGVWGHSGTGYGVYGASYGANANADGVHGFTNSAGASGAAGVNNAGGVGVYGSGGTGVTGTGSNGVLGYSSTASGVGVGAYNSTTGDALFAENQTNGSFAAFFLGNVDVDGTLSKAGGSFKIDHPLDPANKYLYHSFVESPDMMNIYNGNITTDGNGDAVVTMPDWFDALNSDFRYQLTVIGQFAQAIISGKMANRSFSIKTDKPNVEVSWQVTGVRHDAWANAHRIPVEQPKPASERGFYLHPELFGAPAQKGIAWARHPQVMKQLQEEKSGAPPLPQQKPSPRIQAQLPPSKR